jgi:hypothetical protein
MKSKNAAFIAIASLCVELLCAPPATAEFIPTKEITSREQIVDSVAASHELVLAAFYQVMFEGRILGVLLAYDDHNTKRPEDYLELYDIDTNLVAVGWFDRFGIQRIAIDRGLFDGGSILQGVFVTLLDGDAL